MPPTASSSDWAASVDAIVQRAPKFALERESLSAQVRLLALLGSAAPLNVLLDGLATYVETWAEGLYCSVLLADPGASLLRPGAAPSLPAAYVQAIDPVPIGIGQGSCGTAAARREMVTVEDVERSELWERYASIALAHGLRACWSVPVLDDARALLGTLAMYYRVPRRPSTREIDLIQFAASLAALVIQRHRDAERLRRYELAINAAQLPMWEYDVESDTLRGNIHWHRAVGYDLSEEEARQRTETWLSEVHPDDVPKYERILKEPSVDQTGFFESEIRIRQPSGAYSWLLDRARVVERSASGAPLKVVGVSIDIEARKRVEGALRESERRFRAAFESAAIGMALVAPDGRWLRVNEALCRIVGYSAEELLKIDFQTITHPDDLEKDLSCARQMLAGTLSYYEMEKRYFHKSGHTIWILLSVSLVRDDEGRPLYFLPQIQDITARKQAEERLREATQHEQQRLGREIHDGLGQELSGLAYLAGSLARAAGGTDPAFANDLATLEKIANQSIRTCRNIARGVSPLTESRGSLVQALRHLVEGVAAGGPVSLNLEAIESAPLTLPWAHRDHLYRIAQEAISNALRHSGGDAVTVRIEVDPTVVRIEIADNGRGFDPHRVAPKGLGIDSMRLRAAAIGASLSLRSPTTGGALVVCECPQPPAAPERTIN